MLLTFLKLYFYESFLQRGNWKFPTWIQKHLDTLQTVTYMAKNYIYVFVSVKTKAITFLHCFLLLKDVLMTKTKQINIIKTDFTHLTKATLLT